MVRSSLLIITDLETGRAGFIPRQIRACTLNFCCKVFKLILIRGMINEPGQRRYKADRKRSRSNHKSSLLVHCIFSQLPSCSPNKERIDEQNSVSLTRHWQQLRLGKWKWRLKVWVNSSELWSLTFFGTRDGFCGKQFSTDEGVGDGFTKILIRSTQPIPLTCIVHSRVRTIMRIQCHCWSDRRQSLGKWWGVAVNTDRAPPGHMPLTSCCVAHFLTDQGPFPVHGLGTGDSLFRISPCNETVLLDHSHNLPPDKHFT